jgi:hypothetical protein
MEAKNKVLIWINSWLRESKQRVREMAVNYQMKEI